MALSVLTDTFRLECLNGLHRANHEYRLALYRGGLDGDMAQYSAANEVAGTGYTAGGLVVSGRRLTEDRDVIVLAFDDAVWPVATIEAAQGLIYNASLSTLPSVAVLSFEQPVASTNGPFRVPLADLLAWGR